MGVIRVFDTTAVQETDVENSCWAGEGQQIGLYLAQSGDEYHVRVERRES